MYVTYQLKSFFLDRVRVANLVEKRELALLNRIGGFSRKMSRRSIRSGGKSGIRSKPGEPPRYHTKDPVKSLRNILYGYDPAKRAIVVGPVLLNGSRSRANGPVSGTVPSTLEKGGRVRFREVKAGTKWRNLNGKRPRPGQPVRVKTVTVEPRPFMSPTIPEVRNRFKSIYYGTA